MVFPETYGARMQRERAADPDGLTATERAYREKNAERAEYWGQAWDWLVGGSAMEAYRSIGVDDPLSQWVDRTTANTRERRRQERLTEARTATAGDYTGTTREDRITRRDTGGSVVDGIGLDTSALDNLEDSTWDFIGVPEGFRPVRQPRVLPASSDAWHRDISSRPMEVDPIYRDDDEYHQLRNLPPESISRLQEQMQRAGFNVDVGNRLDPATANAMRSVMWFANMNGLNWQEALSDLERQNVDSEENAHASARSDWARVQREMTRDTYLAPSYETMAEDVKSLFRQRLGRDPQDYEIELLSEELSASHQAWFNQNQDVQRQAALRSAALDINSGFEEGDEPIAVPGMAPDQVAVDPIANFQAKFDELYKAEIDTEKAEVDHANTTSRLLSNFGTLNQRMMN